MFAIVNNKEIKKQDAPFYVRAKVDTDTIVDTAEERSFWVTAATDAPVFRRSWEENFNEILEFGDGNLRVERLDEGAVPLLNNHYQWDGVFGQMGTVSEYRIEKNQIVAKILFSSQEKFDGIWGDIKKKIIRSISAGYRVFKYLREVVAEGSVPNYRAVDWEVVEISLAPVPADAKSKVRKEENGPSNEVEIENFKPENRNMAKENAEVVPVTTNTPENQERSAASTTPVTTPVVDADKIRKEATAAEQTRCVEVRKAVKNAKLEEAFGEKLITDGTSLEESRRLIIDKMAEVDTTPTARNAGNGNIVINVDETEKTRAAISCALLNRANPGAEKLEDKAQDYRFMSMLDIARSMLIAGGENALRYGPSEVVKRAISTTDFPNMLNSTVERSIRRTYDAIPAEWKHIAKQNNNKDFRERTGYAYDEKVTFEEVAEGGEYKHSVLIAEDNAKLRLKTFGRMIKITRQAIINDDLSVFEKLPAAIAYGAADFQASKVWGLITGNKKTPDGKTIFHADHANLASGGGNVGAPSEALLSKARTAMWRQTTPTGKPLPIAPKFLVVPIELLTTAEKIMQSLLSSAAMDTNTMKGKFEIMTSPYLTSAVEWYLAGDTSRLEGLVYSYLEGEEGLFIDKEISFNDDTVTTKARIDFDCSAWDYRGWYKNPGA